MYYGPVLMDWSKGETSLEDKETYFIEEEDGPKDFQNTFVVKFV